MRRRALLGLLGTSLSAGCATLGGPSAEPSASPAPLPSDSPIPTEPPSNSTPNEPAEPDRRWSLVEFETLPLSACLLDTTGRTPDGGRWTMQFVGTATDHHPARIRGVFRNANDFENTFELQDLPLFRNVVSASPGGWASDDRDTYSDELLLAPTQRHTLAETVPELRLADDGRWRLAQAVDGPWFPEQRQLDAGESFALEYALVGRPAGTGFPRGRYRFEGAGDQAMVVSVWSTDRPGPEGDSRFTGADPPTLPEAETMAWAHDAGAQTAIYLEPSAERAELSTNVSFTLVNHAKQPVAGNPYFWRLWKLVDTRWFHVAPSGWPAPLLRLPPGAVHETTVAAFEDHTIDCDARSVGHLGAGRYAYEVGIGQDGVTHAALLQLDGPAATVEPTDGVNVTRDGNAVRVRWPQHAGEVPAAILELHRTRSAQTRLIPEQVMQPRNVALRNTLPFLGVDVDRVKLITDRNTVSRGARTSGYEDGTFRFQLQGQAYEAAAQFGTGG